jgi:hypothetical protein
MSSLKTEPTLSLLSLHLGFSISLGFSPWSRVFLQICYTYSHYGSIPQCLMCWWLVSMFFFHVSSYLSHLYVMLFFKGNSELIALFFRSFLSFPDCPHFPLPESINSFHLYSMILSHANVEGLLFIPRFTPINYNIFL